MSIKVDPTKLEDLSVHLKQLERTVEGGEHQIYSVISQLIREIRSEYSEWEVQQALNEVEDDLREIRKQAAIVTEGLARKSSALSQAAGQYQDKERTAQAMIEQYQLPSSYYTPGGGLAGEGADNYLKDQWFENPIVQELHLKAMNGTEEEQKEAKEKLDAIFQARNTIARAQVAYAVYKAFGNQALMTHAHKEATKQRKILKEYGIHEDLYGERVKLDHLYPGSPLSACSYDPSLQIIKDNKPILILMPLDNQYIYLLSLIKKGESSGAWARKQLDEIHKLLSEIGRAQVAWYEYKAKDMKKEMDGAHIYAEKLRTILKEKYSLSSEMVDDTDYKFMWTGAGAAGKYLNVEGKNPSSTPLSPGKRQQAFDLISVAQQIVFGNEGGYSTVSKDDGKNLQKGYPGGISIGKLQWHESRAYDLLLRIIKQDIETAKKILGENSNVFKELTDQALAKKNDRWKARVLTDEEAKAISKLISTDIGIKYQDEQARLDMREYLNIGKKQGISDEKALIYFTDLYNQSPKGALRIINKIKVSGKEITLVNIHEVSLSDDVMGKYVKRRKLTYTKCSQLSKPGINELNPGEEITSNIVVENEGIRRFLSSAEKELEKGFKENVPKGKKEGDNNTPYGKWYGKNYQPWCAMFVSYCANQAGILGTIVPKFASVEEGKKWYKKEERYKDSSSDYIPKAGDTIFFRKNNQNHTGIVTGYDPKTKTIYTIEGNTSDKVARRSYNLEQKNYIVGYGVNGGIGFGTIPENVSSGDNQRTR
ncbi:CHAP domain-containing protein [Paenibacillus aceti]|uniref:Peptidase C51 domain-containing protein n=1 Tax=Paenibacillus aceti TaxID=1820010 RepID=A0ABQ1VWM8_9BACL|nr:CHAP domain-containing protein [Paenibacillus aceti]GGG02746.1 hypothetical protein GCM10010913_25600 [Paenibacillus aceti]